MWPVQITELTLALVRRQLKCDLPQNCRLLLPVVGDSISIPNPGIKPKFRLCVRGHNGGGVASFIHRSTRCVSVHAVKSEGEAGRRRDVSAEALDRVKYGKPFSGSEQYVRRPFKDFAQL